MSRSAFTLPVTGIHMKYIELCALKLEYTSSVTQREKHVDDVTLQHPIKTQFIKTLRKFRLFEKNYLFNYFLKI